MTRARPHGVPTGLSSLSVRYVVVVLVAVTLLGTVLGLVMGFNGVRSAAEERERGLRAVGSALALSIMPILSDESPSRVQAQLESVAALNDPEAGIVCVRVIDAAGTVIAESEPECTCDDVSEPSGWLAALTGPRVVVQPIAVDGMTIGSVSVQFEPIGLEAALWRPLRATSLVVLLAVLVFGVWAMWFLVRNLVEPIEDLEAGAGLIAQGRRDVHLAGGRTDELGRLARALDEMTGQLDMQEHALWDSYRTLEDAYGEQARMREQVQAAMQTRSDFVAIASHELRSPLAVIRLYAEMLGDGDFGALPGDLREAVDAIISASGRLATIVTALIDVALLDRGVMPLELSETRLDEIVREAIRDADRLGEERGIRVRGVGRLPRTRLEADRIRIRQVLDNLLSNAIKYSDPPSDVEVSMGKDAERVRIHVADRGRGIPPDREEVLFAPFGRVDTGENADTSGIGLGLPISAAIANAHGGRVTYEPNEGSGTIFTLELPLRRARRARQVRADRMTTAQRR